LFNLTQNGRKSGFNTPIMQCSAKFKECKGGKCRLQTVDEEPPPKSGRQVANNS